MDANYRHAYGEVLNAVQELDSSLQKSLYATTAAMECTVCTDIYSNAQTAEMALGVLPVNSHSLERIARNIALAGDYARTLSRNAAEGRTFTSEELEHLHAFSDATTQLSTQLAALGQSLYDGAVTTTAHVRSTESLENLGLETDLSDTLEEELAALADSFEELPLPIADGSYQVRTAADYAMLAGRGEVTEAQAQATAAAFLDMDAARLQATGRSEGAVPCWNFDIDDGDDTSYIAVTVSGGEVLRYYSSCAGGDPALSFDEAVKAAAAFLRARGYDGMRLIDTEDAGQSLICTFCYVQDDVLCTADQLRVRVRLDDGAVCGFSSSSYLDTHRARTLPADTIGVEAGQAAVPGALQVVDARTAFLRLYGARETLCYEYRAALELAVVGGVRRGADAVLTSPEEGERKALPLDEKFRTVYDRKNKCVSDLYILEASYERHSQDYLPALRARVFRPAQPLSILRHEPQQIRGAYPAAHVQ